MFDGEHNSLAPTGGSFAFHSAVPPARKKRAKNQRRFSEAQIKSLESIFRTETKLEPRKKLQVAAELGLQPRQVGIWFQNKRARWKSKQLERDHSILRSKYNAMASQVELLRQEKQSLMTQLQSLSSLIQGCTDKGQCCRVDGDSGNPGSGVAVPSDEDSSIKAEYLGMEEEAAFMGMVEAAENSLTSAENWEDPLDECCSDYEWWDFWS